MRTTHAMIPSSSPSPDPDDVRRHLELILDSPVFRSSQRSQQFLRFVVETSLANDHESLKERVLGERIFGRPPDYDTGQDSIVRTKANEVRRRLAQYYDLHPESHMRIEIPSGAYAPQIHVASPLRHPALPRRRQPSWIWIALSLPLITAVLIAANAYSHPALVPAFWAPFLSPGEQVVLCIPSPEAYRIYGEQRDVLLRAFKPRAPNEGPPASPPFESLRDVQIVAEPGMTVGLGDAHAMTLLYAYVASRSHAPQIRHGRETTFAELRSGPSILIGGFTNRWTLDLLQGARFAFEAEGDDHGIRDRTTGKFVCRKNKAWEPRPGEDCAVITRLSHSKTGYALLIAAGLDHYGTSATGEILTRSSFLERALAQAPVGWQDRNLQIVFRTEVVRDSIGPPQWIASHVW